MRLFYMLLGILLLIAPMHARAELARPYCNAKGFYGSNVESAVSACLAARFQAYICARNVSCTPGIPICYAQGFAGSTIESAIYICGKAGFDRYLCGRNVYCN